MTFTVTLSLGQSIFPKETVNGGTAGAEVVGAGGGVLAVAVGLGVGVVFTGVGVVFAGAGVVFVAVGFGFSVAAGEEGSAVPVGVAEGSVVEEASEVLFPPVKAGMTINAPITKKIAAMITLTGCIPAPPESIA
ncbi:hypothetical protein ABGB12_24190 [Actinocorallia sp. B10E7]|uniref:hypothetical protein n=1 Tax=Actinocorallia sp. B10E7 TaxID=3153558 RepID=UPI00325E32C6